MKKIFTLLLVTVSLYLNANDDSFYIKNRNCLIKEINIVGLKRTHKSVVTDKLNIRIGSKLSDFNEVDFSQDILKTGILKEPIIEYRLDSDEIIIDIILSEKWSLIPAPIVSINSEDVSTGVVLFESNFLGLNKVLFIQGIYSTKDGISFAGSFQDYLISNKLAYYIAGGINNIEEMSLLDFEDNEISTYSNSNIFNIIGLYYHFNRDLILGLYLNHNYFDISHMSGESLDFNGTSNYLGPKLAISVDRLTYTDSVSTGFEWTTTYDFGIEIEESDIYQNIETSLSYTLNPLKDLYFRTGGSFSLFDKPYLIESYFGSIDYSNTIPSISHDEHFAGDIQVEYSILKFSWATFSIKGSFEGGVYNRDGSEFKTYFGPAVGVRMYLSGLSVPAMGINCGYNIESGLPNFSLSLGF